MRPVKEDTAHELYLRTSSATKQSAPLKHYANVTGKFTVEPGLDRVKDMLREKTSDAAKQRDDRRTIFINAPPPPPPKQKEPAAAKKKKDHTTSMFRNAVRPSDQAKLNAAMSSSAAATASRVASPAPPKPRTNEASAPLRRRLIHFLAVSERQQDTIIKMVAGPDCDHDTRQELLDLLNDVCVPQLHFIYP
jgi:RNA polymerase II elongation factor ELL